MKGFKMQDDDKTFSETLDEVGEVIHGKQLDVIIPVLVSLLCACAETSNMPPHILILYFMDAVNSHFNIAEDKQIH